MRSLTGFCMGNLAEHAERITVAESPPGSLNRGRECCFDNSPIPAQEASPVIRFGRSASYRARALPPELFPAIVLAFLQPTCLLIVGCGQ